MITLRLLQPDDADLDQVADQLNSADSEVTYKNFSGQSLRQFLTNPDNFYLTAFDGKKLAGAIHGYRLLHPTGVRYLYVDEVDTVKEFRRQGVASAMMKEVFGLAKTMGAAEVWLGTEHDNEPAKALYESLKPDEVESGPIYTWKVKL